jgi:hypothetical protein
MVSCLFLTSCDSAPNQVPATLLLVADDLLDFLRGSNVNRQLACLVPYVQLGAVAEQTHDDVGVSVFRGEMERSLAIHSGFVLLSPLLYQILNHRQVTVVNRHMERSAATRLAEDGLLCAK